MLLNHLVSLVIGHAMHSYHLVRVCINFGSSPNANLLLPGSRACLGRKYVVSQTSKYFFPIKRATSFRFFETEGIAILTILVSKYEIKIKEEPMYAGETFEQKKARVLQPTLSITLK
jgi:hypothetical protein